METVLHSGPEMIKPGKLSPTPRAKVVIRHAEQEAKLLDCQQVGTEHLLLGLLKEKEGIAAIVLNQLGITYEKALHEVAALLGKESALEAFGVGRQLQRLCEAVGTNDPMMALVCAIETVKMFDEFNSALGRFQKISDWKKGASE